MKVYTKSLVFVLLTALGLTIGCKKNNTGSQKTIEVIPPKTEIPEKAYLPIQIATGTTKMLFNYSADHSLTKVDYGDGTSDALTYDTQGKPLSFEQFNGSKLLYYTEYVLDKDGMVIRGDQFTYDKQKNQLGIGYFTLTYDAKQLSVIRFFDNKESLIRVRQRTYTPSGNLTSEKNDAGEVISNYAYDDKNGLFKNADYSWLFTIEKENILLLSAINNIQTCDHLLSTDTKRSFSYVYTINKYPEVINSTMNEKTTSSTVTYKQIE